MNASERELYDLLISHQIDLYRLDAGQRARILSLLDELGMQMEARLLRSNLTAWSRGRVETMLADVSKVIDAYYTRAQDEMGDALTRVARVEYQNTIFATLLDTHVPVQSVLETVVDETLVQGAPMADWWERQSQDTALRFSQAVRQGIVSGESPSAIVKRIIGTPTSPGVLSVSKRNAQTLVHSSISAVSSESRMRSYKDNDDVVSGVRQLSTLDGKTSVICAAYADGEWSLDGEPINDTELPFNGGPPRHWNCRSVLVPIVDEKNLLGFEIDTGGTRAAAGGEVSDDFSFSDWLERQPKEQQDEQLGAGRAELWREGKLTLSQLLSLQGNPLSMDALERRAARRSRR